MQDDFIERLVAFCDREGITPTQLARLCDVDKTRAWKWLNGKNGPRDRDKVVRALGMTMSGFYRMDIKRRGA